MNEREISNNEIGQENVIVTLKTITDISTGILINLLGKPRWFRSRTKSKKETDSIRSYTCQCRVSTLPQLRFPPWDWHVAAIGDTVGNMWDSGDARVLRVCHRWPWLPRKVRIVDVLQSFPSGWGDSRQRASLDRWDAWDVPLGTRNPRHESRKRTMASGDRKRNVTVEWLKRGWWCYILCLGTRSKVQCCCPRDFLGDSNVLLMVQISSAFGGRITYQGSAIVVVLADVLMR